MRTIFLLRAAPDVARDQQKAFVLCLSGFLRLRFGLWCRYRLLSRFRCRRDGRRLRHDRLLDLARLRRCARLFLRGHVHGIRFIDRLFEPFDRFPQSFSQLRDFSRPENNEDDEQDKQ